MLDIMLQDALAPLIGEGWIDSALFTVRSGKEATVLCCRGGSRCPQRLVAAKVYRPREHRGFRNDAVYRQGRMARNTRVRRAVESASAFGQEAAFAMWLDHEQAMLARLAGHGLPVPRPIAVGGSVLLMPFFGDEQGAAPCLHEADEQVRGEEDAARIAETILETVRDMLHLHVVHGDLSPYNVLLWQGEPVVIDLPQAVDPRLNRAASTLLERDVARICDWARSHGADYDAHRIARDLWHAFREGRIG